MKLEKITTESGRWYDDACGTAHALELVGERWSLLIMRELMFGPRRFSDLKASLPGVSANVLTQRLERLEGAGIIVRRRLDPPASVQVYDLTAWGLEAEVFIREMGRWAARSPAHDGTLHLSAVSAMMSLRTMFDAQQAAGLDLDLGFEMGADRFRARVRDGALIIERGGSGDAETLIVAQPEAIAGAIYDPEGDLAALVARGDPQTARRFATLFDLPEKT